MRKSGKREGEREPKGGLSPKGKVFGKEDEAEAPPRGGGRASLGGRQKINRRRIK